MKTRYPFVIAVGGALLLSACSGANDPVMNNVYTHPNVLYSHTPAPLVELD